MVTLILTTEALYQVTKPYLHINTDLRESGYLTPSLFLYFPKLTFVREQRLDNAATAIIQNNNETFAAKLFQIYHC